MIIINQSINHLFACPGTAGGAFVLAHGNRNTRNIMYTSFKYKIKYKIQKKNERIAYVEVTE